MTADLILALFFFALAGVLGWLGWPLRKGGWIQPREVAGLAFILLLPSARRQLEKILERRRQAPPAPAKLQRMTFTSAAQAVISQAETEARSLGHSYIGVTHLLLGLSVIDGTASDVLHEQGISYDDLRSRIAQRMGTHPELPAARYLTRTYRFGRALDIAREAAAGLPADTEHLLLGILGVPSSDGAQVLDGYASPATVKEAVLAAISGPPAPEPPLARLARLSTLTRTLEDERDSLAEQHADVSARAAGARKELLDAAALLLGKDDS